MSAAAELASAAARLDVPQHWFPVSWQQPACSAVRAAWEVDRDSRGTVSPEKRRLTRCYLAALRGDASCSSGSGTHPYNNRPAHRRRHTRQEAPTPAKQAQHKEQHRCPREALLKRAEAMQCEPPACPLGASAGLCCAGTDSTRLAHKSLLHSASLDEKLLPIYTFWGPMMIASAGKGISQSMITRCQAMKSFSAYALIKDKISALSDRCNLRQASAPPSTRSLRLGLEMQVISLRIRLDIGHPILDRSRRCHTWDRDSLRYFHLERSERSERSERFDLVIQRGPTIHAPLSRTSLELQTDSNLALRSITTTECTMKSCRPSTLARK